MSKKIILFGAGAVGRKALQYFGLINVHCFCDNSDFTEKLYCGKTVISFSQLVKIHKDFDVIVSARTHTALDIVDQCRASGIPVTVFSDMVRVDDFSVDPHLEKFKNLHSGKRCFVILNGPSLRATDLNRIAASGCVSMACNSIYYIFEQTNWRPDYYFVADVIFNNKAADIDNSIKCTKLISYDNSDLFDERKLDNFQYGDNVYSFRNVTMTENAVDTLFSEDVARVTCCGSTVSYNILQFAVYMGFSEIILLGADNNVDFSSINNDNHFYDAEKESGFLDANPRKRAFDTDATLDLWNYGYSKAQEIAMKRGVKILNATRGGKLEAFPRIDFDELFGREVK